MNAGTAVIEFCRIVLITAVLVNIDDTAALLPLSPAGNVVICVCVLPEVGVTVPLVTSVGMIAFMRVNTEIVFGLSLTNARLAVAGCTTLERNSSPTTAVFLGTTIGNTSEYVPVLTEIVVPGLITAGIAEVVPAVKPVVTIDIKLVTIVAVPDSDVSVESVF